MDVYEAVKKRYSCRAYENKPVEPEKLKRIFDSARLAPSAKNLQDWRFVVATGESTKRKIAKAAGEQMFLANAGAIIVACSNSDCVMSCGQPVAGIDVAIALEHIALTAVQEDLATCWIGSFSPDDVHQILNIPENIEIIELMALGYPADKAKTAKRENLETILCYEKWEF
ncbi:MAG: nitroreductase [Planctomycetes bacterium]|nr:nitroreductase [Planctomycetota bacterium]